MAWARVLSLDHGPRRSPRTDSTVSQERISGELEDLSRISTWSSAHGPPRRRRSVLLRAISGIGRVWLATGRVGSLRYRRVEPQSQTSLVPLGLRPYLLPGTLNRRAGECVESGRASDVPGGHRRARRRGNVGPTGLPRMEARHLVARRCARRTGMSTRECGSGGA